MGSGNLALVLLGWVAMCLAAVHVAFGETGTGPYQASRFTGTVDQREVQQVRRRGHETLRGMDCFKSPDAAAVNADLMFDFNNNDDDGNLWVRNSQDDPLPLCSSSPSFPPNSRCLVCVDRIVFALCRKLTDAVQVTMQAGGEQVDLLKCECPKLSSDDASQSQLLAILIPIFVILLFLSVMFVIYWKRWRNPSLTGLNQTTKRSHPASQTNHEGDLLTHVTAES